MKKNKKGMSTIVASLLMVLLVIILVGVVWKVTKSIIDKNTDTSCFSNYGKITLNNDYTCYDPEEEQFQFSVSVGDVNIEGVVVTLISETSESYNIPNTEGNIKIKMYESGAWGIVELPSKNGGETYIIKQVSDIDAVRIAPVINGKQCEVSDSINEIDNCLSSA